MLPSNKAIVLKLGQEQETLVKEVKKGKDSIEMVSLEPS